MQNLNNEDIDFPMTRDEYVSSWKVFREMSKENLITAKHILSLPSWNTDINSLLDIGCGDGLITRDIVLNSNITFNDVRLLDPDTSMLEEAYLSIKNTNKTRSVNKYNRTLENWFLKLKDVDVILAIHLVYLIKKESFEFIIDNLQKETPLIVVFDSKDSVFAKLWKLTAKKYSDRSNYTREFIDKLDKKLFKVSTTKLKSILPNPLKQKGNVKSSLLSILCYTNYSLLNKDLQKEIEIIINDFLVDDYIDCESICYEIIKI